MKKAIKVVAAKNPMTRTEQMELYLVMRMAAHTAEEVIKEFTEADMVKQLVRQQANNTKAQLQTLRRNLDQSEYVTDVADRRIMKREGAGITLAYMEFLKNMAQIPDALLDHFINDMKQLAAHYTFRGKSLENEAKEAK